MATYKGTDGHTYIADSQGDYSDGSGKRFRKQNEVQGNSFGLWIPFALVIGGMLLANLGSVDLIPHCGIAQYGLNVLRFHRDKPVGPKEGSVLACYDRRYLEAELKAAPVMMTIAPGENFLYRGFTRDEKAGVTWLSGMVYRGEKRQYLFIRVPALFGFFGGIKRLKIVSLEYTPGQKEIYREALLYAREAAKEKYHAVLATTVDEIHAAQGAGLWKRWQEGPDHKTFVYFKKLDSFKAERSIKKFTKAKNLNRFYFQRDPSYTFASAYKR